MKAALFLFCCGCFFRATFAGTDDYYELLGVSRDADNREIRKAFKKLALTMHPDKNPDNPEAQKIFLTLKQAYEVLKDEETRKLYDMHGEEAVKDGFRNPGDFKTWSFYQNQFGLYDDVPEVLTVSAANFDQIVKNSPDYWFIKFYSPSCSYCHTMVPSWRTLAMELSSVVKVGAVNCEEDWVLCRKEGISAYPSLVFYPNKEKYFGDRNPEDMENFVLHKLPSQPVAILSAASLNNILVDVTLRISPWLLMFCKDVSDFNCPSWQSRIKLAHIFDGLVSVGFVDCSSAEIACKQIGEVSNVIYLPAGDITLQQGVRVHQLNYQEIAKVVLAQLPEAELIYEETLESIQMKLKQDIGNNWLIYFTDNEDASDFNTLQYRRLPALLPNIKLGRFNCGTSPTFCREKLHIKKYPTFATYKIGGAIEVHIGSLDVSDIIGFARHSVWAPNLHTLNPSNFPKCLGDGHPWMIDFYAPWCPPCMRLIPEFRRATSLVGGIVKFGSLDCSAYQSLCAKFNVRSYPTLIFFNYSTPHIFSGQFSSHDIATFVEDVLRPPVLALTFESFQSLVSNRGASEIWLVDFYASWCGPCIELAPQWRQLARMFKFLTDIRIASVDCVTEDKLCYEQGVRSYPTIRLYPAGRGNNFMVYNGYHRDAYSLRSWVFGMIPSVVYSLTDQNFADVVLGSSTPWVVDYYAPWCGPCQRFAIEFEVAAKQFKNDRKVKFAKVNCENFFLTCQRASVQAYPTIRYYPGKTGFPQQNPIGVPYNSNKKAEDLVQWLNDLLKNQHINSNVRDEL